MRPMWDKGLALFALAASAIAQTPTDRMFVYAKTTTLSASAEVVTVQRNTNSGNRTIQFIYAYLYSAGACTITLERGGTAATTTAGVAVPLNPLSPNVQTAIAVPYNTSNVGTGTVQNVYQFTAGSDKSISLVDYIMPSGILDNLTFRTSSCTGVVQIQVKWQEK